VPDSFYEHDGDVYVATEATRGPWDPGTQHAGPPAALIGREIERLGGGRMDGGEGDPAQIGRITYEILRSVPIGRRPRRSVSRRRPDSRSHRRGPTRPSRGRFGYDVGYHAAMDYRFVKGGFSGCWSPRTPAAG
jgi:hypothetical protein